MPKTEQPPVDQPHISSALPLNELQARDLPLVVKERPVAEALIEILRNSAFWTYHRLLFHMISLHKDGVPGRREEP